MLTGPCRNTDTAYLTMHSLSKEDLSPGARASKNHQFGFTILLEKSFLLSPNPWKFLVTKLRKPMHHRHHYHGNHHARTKPIDIRYHFIHFVIYNGSLGHPRLARFLTSSGSIPNEGGVHSKWLPSANLRAAICKKILWYFDWLFGHSSHRAMNQTDLALVTGHLEGWIGWHFTLKRKVSQKIHFLCCTAYTYNKNI